jgi:hypothetical protein
VACILVVGVHDAATGRAVMTRLQTGSQERFEAGRKAAVQPPAQPVAPARDGIPDGPYSCSRLSYVRGFWGNLEGALGLTEGFRVPPLRLGPSPLPRRAPHATAAWAGVYLKGMRGLSTRLAHCSVGPCPRPSAALRSNFRPQHGLYSAYASDATT